MKILAISYPPTDKDNRKVKYFCDKYEARQKNLVEAEHKPVKIPEPNLDGLKSKAVGTCKELQLLIQRNGKGVKRDPL